MKTTITKTAKQIKISQGFLSNILAGRRRPNPDIALDISKLTGTPLEIWLFKTKTNLKKRRDAIKPTTHQPEKGAA